ncbi:unnamed protein product [Clonostachys rosea f. rosea IK726]|uniref:Uncharacterized protein n=1 Tax=Clonostachys rosea f. rosea IK726 TaxID=1349383 RepID=A0ACA9TEF9_BIOOC|nr:unnamed protein product [Clonostachys rosea f. rosea IK726]
MSLTQRNAGKDMAPLLRPRQSLSAERFSPYFTNLKSQPYNDPNSRTGGSNNLRSIAWNPVGTLVATGSTDKTLRVCEFSPSGCLVVGLQCADNVATGNPEKPHIKFSTELKGHLGSVEKVAFNPTKDAELCSISSDGVAKFWDVRTKACFNEVKGLGEAFTLAWAPDGQSLIVGNKDDFRQGQLNHTLTRFGLSLLQDDNIFVLSPTSPTPLASHQQSIQTNQIAFCWSGEKIFLTTSEGRIRILSYPNFEPVLRVAYGDNEEFQLSGHTSSCLTAELQPTGRYLATGGSDSIIALWDTRRWLCQRTITSMVGPVRSISFTFDGSFVVGGSDEGSGLEVTHTETGEKIHTIKTAGSCPVVAWAPTRYWLAYSDLGVLRIIGIDDKK